MHNCVNSHYGTFNFHDHCRLARPLIIQWHAKFTDKHINQGKMIMITISVQFGLRIYCDHALGLQKRQKLLK